MTVGFGLAVDTEIGAVGVRSSEGARGVAAGEQLWRSKNAAMVIVKISGSLTVGWRWDMEFPLCNGIF
jgi:hypothetical protein